MFDGFRREGRIEEQQAAVRELGVRKRDLTEQAAIDVSGALLDLMSAREELAATEEHLRFAEQELAQARDRFRSGVAGNADVITASLSLNAARTQIVDSRAAFQSARVALCSGAGHRHRTPVVRPTRPGTTLFRSRTEIPMASTVSPASDTADMPATGKRSPVLPILIVVALIGIGWAAKTILYNQGHVSTDNAQVDGTIVPVLAKVGGFVRTLGVDENDHVKLGQPIVLIDSSEYAVRLAQAEAELAAAAYVAGGKGVDGQAEAQIRSATSQGQVVQAQIESARAAQAKATADLARYKELAAKQIVSKLQLDAAQAAFDQANANLAALQRQAGGGATLERRIGGRIHGLATPVRRPRVTTRPCSSRTRRSSRPWRAS